MKIFYFLGGGFDHHGPSNHLMYAKISKALELGHDVFMICSKVTHGDPMIPEEWKSNPRFKYQAVYQLSPAKNQFMKRYYSQIKYAWDCRKYLKLARNYDVLFIQSSAAAPFTVSIAKHYGKIPAVWNIQDMFPGSSIANGVMTKKWMQKFFYAFQKIAYRKADIITVISEDMKKSVVEQGVSPDKVEVILNWYNDQIVHEVPWEENRFVKAQNLSKDMFYVQYAGTVGYNCDYKAFLHIANGLKEEPRIRIQIIAFGSQYQQLKDEAKEMGLANIDFLPIQPQEMVSDVYSACSVCYIPLKQGVIWNSVPSKAGLLMACKRPVINSVDAGSWYYNDFNENKIGISVPNTDYDASVKAIRYLFENPEECKAMGLRAYDFGKKAYASTPHLMHYLELYKSIAKNSSER